MNNRRVIVTGASGFIGSCVVEALYAVGGYDVVPTSRRAHAGGAVARFGYRLTAADLADPSAVNTLVQGADAIVHCAFGGDSNQRECTQNLLEAATAAKVQCFIHLSTADVYEVQQGAIDEDATILSQGDSYGAIKAQIESLVRHRGSGFPSLVILRPAIVYGPLSDVWTIRCIRRLLAGWRPRREEHSGIGNFVHIADLCHIIEQILSKPPSGIRTYNVVGPEFATWGDYFQRTASALGIDIAAQGATAPSSDKLEVGMVRTLLRLLPVSLRIKMTKSVASVGAGVQVLSRWRRLHLVEPSASEKALFSREVRYSTARLIEDGFRPRVSLDEGIRQSVQWAQQIGLA